ncbi:MAG TPA: hypothetical protein PK228_09205 [Saprospiraceae bacterium]|nr:hypothetical protein [Saprospiraceae bacterium]
MRAIITLLCSLSFSICFGQINWQPLGGPDGPGWVQDIEIAPSGEYFLANEKDVYHSVDGGVTWAVIPTSDPNYPPGWRDMTILPDGTLIAIQGTKVYRSAPGDNFLTEVHEQPQGGFFLNQVQHTFDGTLFGWDYDFKMVLTSSDQGSSWDTLYNFTSPVYQYNGFSINGNGKNYAVSPQRIIRFDENGGNTVNINIFPGQLQVPFSHGIAYLPDEDALVVAAGSQLRITYDDGNNWDTLPAPSPVITFTGMYYDQFNSRLFACFKDTIWVTSTLGTSWDVFLPLGKSTDGGRYALVSDAGDRMLLSVVSCDQRDLLRSENGGQTWTSMRGQFHNEMTDEIMRDHQGNLYAHTCLSTWLRSVDNGESWEILRPGPDTYAVYDLLVTHEGVLFATDYTDGVFRSLDHGANWQLLNAVSYSSQLYEGGDGAIYLITSQGNSYISDNLGVSWKDLGYLNQNRFFTHPDGSLYRLATVNNTLLRSNDHGFTWAPVTGLIPANMDFNSVFYCAPNGDIYVSNLQGGGTFVTTDHFATGNLISGTAKKMVADYESNLFGIGFSNEFIQLDFNTGSWKSVDSPLGYDLLAVDIDRDQYLYIGGTKGVIHRSAEPTTTYGTLTGRVEVVDDCNDANGSTLPGLLVKAEGANGTFITSTAFANNTFRLFVPQGDYNLSVVPKNAFYENCQPPLPVIVPSPDTPLLTIREKALCPYLRVNSTNGILRRCFESNYTITWCNDGTADATDAYLEVTLDSFFQFVSASLPVSSVNGNTLSFDLGDLAPGQCGNLQLKVKVSCDAALGQIHCLTTHIFPDELCLPELDTTAIYQECAPNVGSFDPNDKTAFVNGREESEEFLEGADLDFLIRFQNTGTDTAFRVVVQDRLSPLLDAETFQPLSASHPYHWELQPDPATGEHIVRFIFDNILLPDSNINEAASHGFVKFAVQPKLIALQQGPIQNSADIFFDYNPPVKTNTVSLKYVQPTISTIQPAVLPVKIAPQPFREYALIELDYQGDCLFQLFDLHGRLLREDQATGGRYRVEREQLPSGMYICRFVSDGSIVAAGKLSVQDK